MLRRFIATALACVVLTTVVAKNASAQIVTVSPDVFAQMRTIALAAKMKFPTSPVKADAEFKKQSKDVFGDHNPKVATIVALDSIDVFLLTPLAMAIVQISMTITKMIDLPDEFTGSNDFVTLIVAPKTITAPNIRGVVAFSGRNQVEVVSELKDEEFTTRMGAKSTMAAGQVKIPVSAFAPTAALKLILQDSGPSEFLLLPKDLRRLR